MLEIKWNLLGKALMFLMWPTICVAGFLWFILLDFTALTEVLLGNHFYSFITRLILCVVEVYLVYRTYKSLMFKEDISDSLSNFKLKGQDLSYYDTLRLVEEIFKKFYSPTLSGKRDISLYTSEIDENTIIFKIE